ncbi:MAG: tetratricopeptide repeat protein, partial [Planctomycetes bacterium]|nr:tetratricopeptide repeat protein [Planctomycetota bacterium]
MLTGAGGCGTDWSRSKIQYGSGSQTDDDFALEIDRPPTAKTLYAMAALIRTQERPIEYEAILQRIVRQYPKFLPAHCDLAEHLTRQNRVGEAINALAAGLRVSKRDPVLLNNIGLCHLMKGDYEQAALRFEQAAGADPQQARYRANLAVALGMLGRDSEARALFRQVIGARDVEHNLGILRKAHEAVSRSDRWSLWAEPSNAPEEVRVAREEPIPDESAVDRVEVAAHSLGHAYANRAIALDPAWFAAPSAVAAGTLRTTTVRNRDPRLARVVS